MDRFNSCVIIDYGSKACKAGLTGDLIPRVILPSVVPVIEADPPNESPFFHPIEHSIVTQWDHLETLWHHLLLRALQIKPSDHPFLIAEPPPGPKANRERMAQLMFETFDVPALNLKTALQLTLAASGHQTGIVLDVGHGVTHSAPIFENALLPHAIHRLDLAGQALTDYMHTMLKQEHSPSSSSTSPSSPSITHHLSCLVKHNSCRVALDFEQEIQATCHQPAESYLLPDGQTITLGGAGLLRCPEALFQPSLLGLEADGIHKMIFRSITRCDHEIQDELFQNIVIAGGSSLFPGLVERLRKELASLAPPHTTIHLSAIPNRQYAAWIGGSILSSLSTFPETCISRAEYAEVGPSIIHKDYF